MEKISTTSNSSYKPFSLTDIEDMLIFSIGLNETYQTLLNNKFLLIIRDLLIRIEKLEKKG